MKISKLFHWLYAILMFLPFMVLIFNLVSCITSGVEFDLSTILGYFNVVSFTSISSGVYSVFNYCIFDLFGFSGDIALLINQLLTYWLCVSLIWLVFDLVMYIPLMVHKCIDKAVID